MPAGDASRTWFPEMLDRLRTGWRGDLSFVELVGLRDELDAMLHRIRSEPDVSVRAMVLSLARFAIAPTDEVKALEKRWAAYRKQNGLDLYGKMAAPPGAGDPACAHSSVPR